MEASRTVNHKHLSVWSAEDGFNSLVCVGMQNITHVYVAWTANASRGDINESGVFDDLSSKTGKSTY